MRIEEKPKIEDKPELANFQPFFQKDLKQEQVNLDSSGNDELASILYSEGDLEVKTFGLFLPYPAGYSVLAGPKGTGKSSFAKFIVSQAYKEEEVFPLIISKEENFTDIVKHCNLFGLQMKACSIIDRAKFQNLFIAGKRKPSLASLVHILREKEKIEVPILAVIDPLPCVQEFSFLKDARSSNYFYVEDRLSEILNFLFKEKIILLGVIHSPKSFEPEKIEQNPYLAIQGVYGSGSLPDFSYGYGVIIPNFDLQTSSFIYEVKNSPWTKKEFRVRLFAEGDKTFCLYEHIYTTTRSFSRNIVLTFQQDPIRQEILKLFYYSDKPLLIGEIHKKLEDKFPDIDYDQVRNRIVRMDRLSLLKLNFISQANDGYKITAEGKLFFEHLKEKMQC